jgi:FlaA1/EpsC-like NDP-sugar epimerase
MKRGIFSYAKRAYATRLLLLFVDTAVVFFSYLFSWLILDLSFYSKFDLYQIVLYLFVIIVPLWFSFRLFRPYSIVLRFTGEKDLFSIGKAISLCFALLFLVNLLWAEHFFSSAFKIKVLFVSYLLSLVLSSFVRLIIRSRYRDFYAEKKRDINVVIFGAGQAGIITKRSIESDGKSRFKVVAFLDDNNAVAFKLMDNVQIYPPSEFADLVKKYNIKKAIIAIHAISRERKKEFGDMCLEHGVLPLVVPPVDTWINGNFTTGQLREFKVEDLLNRPPININKENISNYVEGRVVLVTGAAGSIGSEICRQIIQFKPSSLIILDNAETPLVNIELELISLSRNKLKITTLIADVTFKERCRTVFEHYRPDLVFHAAAYKHVPIMENNPSEAVRINVLGTKNLADLSVEYKVEKFVMISTDKAVNPTNVMGASKRIAEIYIQSFNYCHRLNSGTAFITTRFGNVLGSNGSVVPRFRQQLQEGGPITVTHPDITRYFMTIPEACQLVLEAGSIGKGGEIFLFDMGKPVKIVDLAKNMIKLSGKQVDVDIKIEFTGLRPGEKLYEELLNKAEDTTPTHNSSITIANVREQDFEQVSHDIEKLILCSFTESDMKIVAQMKRIVPEFISNASKFEALDKKKMVYE